MKTIQNICKSIIIIGIATTTFLIGKCYGYKEALPLLNAYDNYNAKCEILLDSIAKYSEYPFGDTIGETDTYYYYLEAREHLDSILYIK